MVKFRSGTGKFLAAALLAAACMAVTAPSVYADGPAGPASDTEIAQHKDAATGPGAQNQGTSGGGGQEGQSGQGEQTGTQGLAGGQGEQTGTRGLAGGQQTNAAQQELAQSQDPSAQDPAQNVPQEQVPEEQPVQSDGLVLSGGRYIDPSKPMVALTFDDGPYAPVGNRLMDCLEQNNGRATFFVVGNRVPSYKAEIKRMQDNGHEVANHTYEHKYLTKLGAAEIRSQIDRCNQTVASVTGVSPTLVRLPGGLKNNTVLANVNFPMIMWNIDTLDWKTRNAQQTVAAVVGKVQDGDIVLMHELYTATADAADTIIPALVQQGYQLVTVSELAQFRGGVQAGKLYNKFRP